MPETSNLEALATEAEASSSRPPVAQTPEFQPISDLPPSCPEAPDLTPELVPPSLRSWLVDSAERMQVPLEFTAVPAVVSLSAIVGRRLGIHPKAKDDWLVVPNLWGGIVARPGMLKSPALAEALQPIRRLAAEARRDYRERILVHEVKLESLRSQEAAIKNLLRRSFEGRSSAGAPADLEERLAGVRQEIQSLETNLVERRYIVNDSTTEKLGELLAANPHGLLLERDELAGWLLALEREDRKSDREFFLEAWNGLNSYTYDRIGRGTIHIPALCISIIGGIQPTKLGRFVREALDGGFAADGLLQRFQMLVHPEDTFDWRLVDERPDLAAREVAYELFAALDRRKYEARASRDGVPALRFAADAQELFFAWLTTLQGRLVSPELKPFPAFESHLSKYRSLMPSLALLFHLVEQATGSEIGPVSLKAAELAADWCEYLELHARKIYSDELGTETVAAHALAAKIRKGEIYDAMTVREVYRANWSGLRTPEVAFGGLSLLERHGWIAIVVVQGRGRPSQVIRLNPARTEDR